MTDDPLQFDSADAVTYEDEDGRVWRRYWRDDLLIEEEITDEVSNTGLEQGGEA